MKNIFETAHIINPENLEIASNSRIDDGTFLYTGKGIKIGEYSCIHFGSCIVGGGYFEMGKYSVITYNCSIITGYPVFNTHMSTLVPKEYKNRIIGEIILGDEVFIGSNSVISVGRSGKTVIGDGAIIAAGSYIDKDVSPWTIIYPDGSKKQRNFKSQFY